MRVNTENLFITSRIEAAVALILKNATKEIRELISKTPIIITTEMLSLKHHGSYNHHILEVL